MDKGEPLVRSGSRWLRQGARGHGFDRQSATPLWTHRDSGGMQFNYSEIAGNSAAKLGFQIGIETAAAIVNECWHDLE